MKIKEVEALVGIKKTNIRFYEREGLLNPERSEENNYREYSEEDVRRLEQIKMLRMLDVPTADIRLLFDDKLEMQEVMERRLESIDREEKALQEMRQLCQTIITKQINLDSMDETIFEDSPKVWKERLQEVLEYDLVNDVISKKKLNLHLMLSLVYGYFVNALVAFLVSDFFLNYERTVDPAAIEGAIGTKRYFPQISLLTVVLAIVVVFSIVALYCSSSVKVHVIIFHISAIITTPFIIEFTRIYTDTWEAETLGVILLKEFSNVQIATFWIMIMIYVVGIYILSLVCEKMFSKRRYMIPTAIVITGIYTYIAFVNTGEWKIPLVCFLIMTIFIGMSWAGALMDRESYNRYYAVIIAARMMNVMGCALINQGRGSGGGRTGLK